MSAYRSETGWVRHGQDVVVPPRRIKRLQPDNMDEPAPQIQGLMVPRKEWIEIPAETALTTAREWVKSMRRNSQGVKYGDDAILVVMDDDEISGVMEIGQLMA
jgi:hypothetical protein